MDSEASLFQSALAAPDLFQNLPHRRVAVMPPQQIVAWTPVRLAGAFAAWLTAPTYVPAPAQTDA